jgi:hypothetical protein
MSGLIHERTPERVAIDEQVLARVKRGIALLEEKHGPNWADGLSLGELDLKDGAHCVLGQLYGEYRSALVELQLRDGQESDECGFSSYAYDSYGEGTDPDWSRLQQTWERVLTPLVRRS